MWGRVHEAVGVVDELKRDRRPVGKLDVELIVESNFGAVVILFARRGE